MSARTVPAGEVIFKEDEDSKEAFWISQGTVRICMDSEGTPLELARLGPGEVFGEMGLIEDRPRSATAIAETETRLEIIDETTFEEAILHNSERLRTYLATLFERLRTTSSLLEAERAKAQASVKRVDPILSGAVPADAPASTRAAPSYQLKMVSVDPNPVTGDSMERPIKKFPFRIGRALDIGSPFALNDLEILDEEPWQISRNHCAIERHGEKYFLRDRGTPQGTVVNGHQVGAMSGEIVTELNPGENEIVFGSSDRSPHRYRIIVESIG